MRNREHLARYQNLRNSEVSHDLALAVAEQPEPSPDGAVLEWLDDMIRDVDDAATRLKRLAERLRET